MKLIELAKITGNSTMLEVSEEPLRIVLVTSAERIRRTCLDKHNKYIPGINPIFDNYLNRKILYINGGINTLFVTIEGR